MRVAGRRRLILWRAANRDRRSEVERLGLKRLC